MLMRGRSHRKRLGGRQLRKKSFLLAEQGACRALDKVALTSLRETARQRGRRVAPESQASSLHLRAARDPPASSRLHKRQWRSIPLLKTRIDETRARALQNPESGWKTRGSRRLSETRREERRSLCSCRSARFSAGALLVVFVFAASSSLFARDSARSSWRCRLTQCQPARNRDEPGHISFTLMSAEMQMRIAS